jgi:hypothetical protein
MVATARTFAFAFGLAAGVSLLAGPGCTSTDNGASGPTACVAAGGQCLAGGGGPNYCGTVGPQNCNPDHNPGGAVCCLGGNGQGDATTDRAEVTTDAQADAPLDSFDAARDGGADAKADASADTGTE